MEIGIEDHEIVDMSMTPPSGGSMRMARSNEFGHNKEFMSKSNLLNRYSEIDIHVEDSSFNQNCPLPIFLKVLVSNVFIL